jgi:hypothetical protein
LGRGLLVVALAAGESFKIYLVPELNYLKKFSRGVPEFKTILKIPGFRFF